MGCIKSKFSRDRRDPDDVYKPADVNQADEVADKEEDPAVVSIVDTAVDDSAYDSVYDPGNDAATDVNEEQTDVLVPLTLSQVQTTSNCE